MPGLQYLCAFYSYDNSKMKPLNISLIFFSCYYRNVGAPVDSFDSLKSHAKILRIYYTSLIVY